MDAVWEFAPWWHRPVEAVLHVAAAFLLAWVVGWTLIRRARRTLVPDAPWTERARAAYPHRAAFSAMAFAAPFGVAWRATTSAGPFTSTLVTVAAMAAAYCGVVWNRVRLERALGNEDVGSVKWLTGLTLRLVLFWPHLVIALGCALFLPFRADTTTWVVLGAALVAMMVAAWGAGFWVAQALRLIHPASERLARIAASAAERTGVELRGAYEVDLPEANAYALPHLGRILFTRRGMEVLGDDGIDALCLHEFAHLGEPRLVRWQRTSGVIVLLPIAAVRPLLVLGGFWLVLGTVAVAIAWSFLVRKWLRGMESEADAKAHAAEEDAGAFARAVEKLYRANAVPVVLSGTAHPHLYDRMIDAGVQPDYPRPDAPPRPRLVALAAALSLVLAVMLWPPFVAAKVAGTEARIWCSIAIDGGHDGRVAGLGRLRAAAGHIDDAVTLLTAAGEMNTWTPQWHAQLATVLADAGRDAAAAEALAEAERRAAEWKGDRWWEDALAKARERVQGR